MYQQLYIFDVIYTFPILQLKNFIIQINNSEMKKKTVDI